MLKLSVPNNIYVGTKTDYVLEVIRSSILIGDILPGTRITEQDVKDSLNVSFSPIREAFVKLESEGLLTKDNHVGTRVTSIDIENARELYTLQAHLQGIAVQICSKKLKEEDILEAERLNNEMKKMTGKKVDAKGLRVANYKLHMILCGINIYPWLTRLISGLWILFPSQQLWLIHGRPNQSIKHHEKIISAIKKGNHISAGNQMRKHLESSMKALYGDVGETNYFNLSSK